jgi:hypothetical protein
MKLWIINNSKFGYKNSKEWSDNMFNYFENIFIPFLKKYANSNDKLIHLGNIFNSSDNINIELLLKVENLFIRISSIIDIIILDGYNEKTGISKLLKNEKIKFLNTPYKNFIPFGYNVLEHIPEKGYMFINNRIDKNILKKFPNVTFFCGYYDNRIEEDNIIYIGAPYQFDNTTEDKGFYIYDTKTLKHKFIENNYSPRYKKITITNISQINELNSDFIDKNKVDIIIDKTLITEKKIKLDVLLSKYNFKSVSYLNDRQEIDFIDSSSISMEELIRKKIKTSENDELLQEFENIINIYKEKY